MTNIQVIVPNETQRLVTAGQLMSWLVLNNYDWRNDAPDMFLTTPHKSDPINNHVVSVLTHLTDYQPEIIYDPVEQAYWANFAGMNDQRTIPTYHVSLVRSPQ